MSYVQKYCIFFPPCGLSNTHVTVLILYNCLLLKVTLFLKYSPHYPHRLCSPNPYGKPYGTPRVFKPAEFGAHPTPNQTGGFSKTLRSCM